MLVTASMEFTLLVMFLLGLTMITVANLMSKSSMLPKCIQAHTGVTNVLNYLHARMLLTHN